jgi:hypothetical protein
MNGLGAQFTALSFWLFVWASQWMVLLYLMGLFQYPQIYHFEPLEVTSVNYKISIYRSLTSSPSTITVIDRWQGKYHINVITTGFYNGLLAVQPCHQRATLTIPSNHLLCTLNTWIRIIYKVDGGLSSCDWSCRRGSGDLALETMHVHIGYSAQVRNPQPSADAPARRTSWKSCGEIVDGKSFPRSAVSNQYYAPV